MAAGLLQGQNLSVQNFFSNADEVSSNISIAVSDGQDIILPLVTVEDEKLPVQWSLAEGIPCFKSPDDASSRDSFTTCRRDFSFSLVYLTC